MQKSVALAIVVLVIALLFRLIQSERSAEIIPTIASEQHASFENFKVIDPGEYQVVDNGLFTPGMIRTVTFNGYGTAVVCAVMVTGGQVRLMDLERAPAFCFTN